MTDITGDIKNNYNEIVWSIEYQCLKTRQNSCKKEEESNIMRCQPRRMTWYCRRCSYHGYLFSSIHAVFLLTNIKSYLKCNEFPKLIGNDSSVNAENVVIQQTASLLFCIFHLMNGKILETTLYLSYIHKVIYPSILL